MAKTAPIFPLARSLAASLLIGQALLVGLFSWACRPAEEPDPVETSLPGDGWVRLSDEGGLEGWTATRFGGEGAVRVEGGEILLEMGDDLTGITWAGSFPRDGYELFLEARRLQGNDFFCGLTFPVGEEHCSLIVGGWGGAVVGLSTVDGKDASENETKRLKRFEDQRWYKIRLRVAAERIEAWIDNDQMVNLERNRVFGVRPEVRLSRPLGVSTWRTAAAVRNPHYRLLDPPGPSHALPSGQGTD